MQLRQAETLGVLDHHDRRLGHVDADLDHRGGDQDLGFALRKGLHRRVLVAALHLAVDEADVVAEEFAQIFGAILRRREIAVFAALDQRADPIDPRARPYRAAEAGDDLVDALGVDHAGVDRLASRRLFPQRGDLHVAEKGQRQGARNRRRGHRQHVDAVALFAERQALLHAEAMLLVDHREAEVAEGDFVLHQRMGADGDMDGAAASPSSVARRSATLSRPVISATVRPAASASGFNVA